MLRRLNINALNMLALFKERLKGAALSPVEVALRKWKRRIDRLEKRRRRHAKYEYCGKRQRRRYAHNRMDEQQRNCHKPGTVQPQHIFGRGA